MTAPTTRRPVYSVTSLAIYEACPWQYYISFVRHVPPPRTRAMEVGTSVHKLIADHLRGPQLLPPQVEGDTAELFNHFLTSRFNVQAVACETPVRLQFEHADVRGRIDTILPRQGDGLEVVDFKSGNGRERTGASESLQLPLYALAVQERYELSPERISWTYYYLRDTTEFSFQGGQYDFAALRARVDRDIEGIQSGRFDSAPGCTCWACTRWPARDTAGERQSACRSGVSQVAGRRLHVCRFRGHKAEVCGDDCRGGMQPGVGTEDRYKAPQGVCLRQEAQNDQQAEDQEEQPAVAAREREAGKGGDSQEADGDMDAVVCRVDRKLTEEIPVCGAPIRQGWGTDWGVSTKRWDKPEKPNESVHHTKDE
jgi:hypothetical protein